MSCCAAVRSEYQKRGSMHTPVRFTLIALLLCLFTGAVTAQQSAAPQVTIVVISTGTGEDHLNFAHNTTVPEKEAAERFERLLRYGGWQGKLLKVRTEAPRSIEGSTLPPMTDVIGRARNVVDRNSGGLPVEPFLRAFWIMNFSRYTSWCKETCPFRACANGQPATCRSSLSTLPVSTGIRCVS